MRYLIIFLLFFTTTTYSTAQWEIKLDPIVLLFAGIHANAEIILNQDWAVETDIFLIPDAWLLSVGGKYYFQPRQGADGLNAGAFIPVYSEGVGFGFFGGYKWLSNKNLLFELALGIARTSANDRNNSFNTNTLPYGKLFIGYRFEGKKHKK